MYCDIIIPPGNIKYDFENDFSQKLQIVILHMLILKNGMKYHIKYFEGTGTYLAFAMFFLKFWPLSVISFRKFFIAYLSNL